ncbi:sugar phosphate isomerase/epimerase family protein [Candidatus Hydrogenedentota bacterium]
MMTIGCQIGTIRGTIEEAGELLKSQGIAGLEVFTSHLEPYYGKEDEMKALLKRLDIRISGAYFSHNGLVLSEEKENALEAGRRAIDFLTDIEADFLVVTGGINCSDKPEGFVETDFMQLGEVLNCLGNYAQDKGIEVVLHPHMGQTIVTLDDLEKLLLHMDTTKAGLCLHAGHQLMANDDPYEMYEQYGNLVRYLHIGDSGKDLKGELKGQLLGEGVLDQDRLMKPILDAGYKGWLIIECRKEGTAPADYIRHACDYIRARGWAE